MSETSPNIAIAQAQSFKGNNEPFLKRHLPVVRALNEYGANVVALNGANDRLNESGAFSRYFKFGAVGMNMYPRDEEIDISAAYDLTGGIGKYTPDVAALNPGSVRAVVLSKESQYDALKSIEGSVAQTVSAYANLSSVKEALDTFESKKLIVKAEKASNKKYGMITGTKDEILAGIESILAPMDPIEDKVLIQEYMDEVHADFPSDLVFANPQEAQVAKERKGLGSEIRVHTLDGRPILVTARAGLDPAKKSPLDDWVHLDNTAVPDHITNLAAHASLNIMEAAQSTDAYLAVDLTPDGRKIIEVNGRNIGTMYLESDRPASAYGHHVTTDAIAGKLFAMSTRKKDK